MKRNAAFAMFGQFVLVLVVLAVSVSLFGGGAFAQTQGLSEEQKRRWLEQHVREISAEEAQRWVASQGMDFLYIGSKELFPGLGKALKGKRVKVYVGEGTKTLPWLDAQKTAYTLFEMPGKLTSDEGVLIALNGYLLGKSQAKPGRYVLVMSPEVANVLYRSLSIYEGFAKGVLKR